MDTIMDGIKAGNTVRHTLGGMVIFLAITGFLLMGSCGQDIRPNTIVEEPIVPGRTYPSIFQAWNAIENKPDESELGLMARHDLVFTGTWSMRINWKFTAEQPHRGLSTALVNRQGGPDLEEARRRRARLRELNPNLKLLCEVRYREGRYVTAEKEVKLWQQGAYPPDSELWLRDKDGNLCPGWGEDADGDGKVELSEIHHMLADFRNPRMHMLIAAKALALKESGLFDGIMLDWWNEDNATTGRFPDWDGTHLTREEEVAARIAILRKIREKVGDDFLILVNSNYRTVPQSAEFVNGLFMECWKEKYNRPYSLKQIRKMESTLLWAEKNLRAPRINCLEGWRVVTEYAGNREVRVRERDSATNKQWMRMITCLGLTHSNGYVLFGDDNAQPPGDHLHNWYDFWDAHLGRPIGKTAETFNSTDGLFIREFEKGWAVYNRSGSPQELELQSKTRAVKTGKTGKSHRIGNLDGEILLKE